MQINSLTSEEELNFNPVTAELFGDDLPKAVKDISDTNRLSYKLTKDNFRRPSRGGQKHSQSWRGKTDSPPTTLILLI